MGDHRTLGRVPVRANIGPRDASVAPGFAVWGVTGPVPAGPFHPAAVMARGLLVIRAYASTEVRGACRRPLTDSEVVPWPGQFGIDGVA